MVHRTISGLTRAIESRLINMAEAAEKMAESEIAKELEDAKELSSGDASYSTLRAENHPYGRGFTSPRGGMRGRRPQLPINKHSGKLQGGFKRVKRDASTGRFSRSARWAVEVHGVDYAKFIIPRNARPGSKMIFRAFWQEIDKRRRQRAFDRKREFKRAAR